MDEYEIIESGILIQDDTDIRPDTVTMTKYLSSAKGNIGVYYEIRRYTGGTYGLLWELQSWYSLNPTNSSGTVNSAGMYTYLNGTEESYVHISVNNEIIYQANGLTYNTFQKSPWTSRNPSGYWLTFHPTGSDETLFIGGYVLLNSGINTLTFSINNVKLNNFTNGNHIYSIQNSNGVSNLSKTLTFNLRPTSEELEDIKYAIKNYCFEWIKYLCLETSNVAPSDSNEDSAWNVTNLQTLYNQISTNITNPSDDDFSQEAKLARLKEWISNAIDVLNHW